MRWALTNLYRATEWNAHLNTVPGVAFGDLFQSKTARHLHIGFAQRVNSSVVSKCKKPHPIGRIDSSCHENKPNRGGGESERGVKPKGGESERGDEIQKGARSRSWAGIR